MFQSYTQKLNSRSNGKDHFTNEICHALNIFRRENALGHMELEWNK